MTSGTGREWGCARTCRCRSESEDLSGSRFSQIIGNQASKPSITVRLLKNVMGTEGRERDNGLSSIEFPVVTAKPFRYFLHGRNGEDPFFDEVSADAGLQ
jgi:hypothetical protein